MSKHIFKKHLSKWIIICIFGICLMILKFFGIGFVFQGTKSMPEGVYFTYPSNNFYNGVDILFMPYKHIENFMLNRDYIQKKLPLLKEIVASSEDEVCIKNKKLYINGYFKGAIKTFDREGRSLPHVKLCRKLTKDEFFVLGVSSPYSFDSRYYGIIQQDQIISKVVKLW